MPFIVRRVTFYLVAAWVALTVNFFIPRAMPGNAVQSVMAKFPNLQPSAYKALEALPDAVVCANDQMAIGLLQAFAKAGVRVPEQVAVVGFDDIFPGSLCDPPLTTVHQPMRQLGEQGCTRLLDRIARPGLRPKVELLPTELVLRSSCGCPPGTMTRRPVPPLKRSRLASGPAAPPRRRRTPPVTPN